MIRDETAHRVPLRLNRYQNRILSSMIDQAKAGKPVRIILLKARKGGATTLVQALGYFLCKTCENWFGLTVAHTADSTRKIFGITRRIRRYDPENAGTKLPKSGKFIEFPTHDSEFHTATAGGQYPGSGDTIQLLHLSELSKWPGNLNAVEDMLLSLMNAVPRDANTIVVIESTANKGDQTRIFEEYWHNSVSGANGFVPIFGAWFDKESAVEDATGLGELTDYEKELVASQGLTPEQLAWRRAVKADQCRGNERLMKQDFPSTPLEAFQAETGRIFPMLEDSRHGRVAEEISQWPEHYRGVDWGGSHAFVGLWIAHRPGPPGFTIDIAACPNTWKQFTTWKRDGNGNPSALGDDCCDAARYVCSDFELTGWMPIYRELFVADSAAQGLSPLNMAKEILRMSPANEVIDGTVCDRSQPGNIQLFVQQGIPCFGAMKRKVERMGEVEDGIARLQALMVADVPLQYAPPELTTTEIIRRMRAKGNRPRFSIQDWGTRLEIERLRRVGFRRTHPDMGVYG